MPTGAGCRLGVRTILAESGLDPRGIGRVVDATTLFTNALIERKGADRLLVTDGFRDMLEIGASEIRPLPYRHRNPVPLAPRNPRLGVSERMRSALSRAAACHRLIDDRIDRDRRRRRQHRASR